MRSAPGLLLLCAALFVGAFTIYHAPTYALLPLSVGAPELSHFIIATALLGAAVAFTAGHRRVRWAAALIALPAVMIPARVWLAVPPTIRAFDEAMAAAGIEGDGGGAAISVPALFTGLRPGSVTVERGLPFAAGDGYALALDLCRPAGDGPHPVVVQIFGGAWRGGARGDNAAFAAALAARGFLVASIDYRLAPRWRWPSQLDDARAAVRWLKANAPARGGDPSRIVMLGRSSGAQIAFIAAMTADDPAIRAIVLYYSPVNLTAGYRVPPVPDVLGLRRIETDFIGGTPDELPDASRDASPISYADRPHPPVLLVHGARDRIVHADYEAALHDRLRRSGTSILLEIPWADHAFDAVSFGPSAQLALHYTERFIDWQLK